ncbi:GbsR/MarR family transcriptional regulator [Nocardiopsis sp. NPDC006938]|uniref:GbsR/MarR family transcriptional regulator n=1 Tax=Nocardiopsis sp. NPDC006938 TaxID=3364337 RepID=UPI00369C3F88
MTQGAREERALDTVEADGGEVGAEEFRDDFVGRFAAYWQSQGRPKAEGRIVGYLLVADRDAVSAEAVAEGAGVSRGSVSQSVRRLRELGFVTLVDSPDSRSRLISMDEDVWGGFLRNERGYLRQQRDLAASALERLPHLGPSSRTRLHNMYDYMTWLDGYHDVLLEQWERYKAERPERHTTEPPEEPGPGPAHA